MTNTAQHGRSQQNVWWVFSIPVNWLDGKTVMSGTLNPTEPWLTRDKCTCVLWPWTDLEVVCLMFRCVTGGSSTTRRWHATARCTRAASTTCVDSATRALTRSTSCGLTPNATPTRSPGCTHVRGVTRRLTCMAWRGGTPGRSTPRHTRAPTVGRRFRGRTNSSSIDFDTRRTASSCARTVGDSSNARSELVMCEYCEILNGIE